MKILILNCGSSSLKYQLIDMNGEQLLAKGLVERIGLADTLLTHQNQQQKFVIDAALQAQHQTPIHDHQSAAAMVLKALTDPTMGVISSMNEIGAVGHRVVHGGEKYAAPVIIDKPVLAAIEECVKLAPLHNPANLTGINACLQLMPTTPMVAVFDTAFHQTMPVEAYMYSLPYEIYQQHKVRRYGFHGTSHKFVAHQAAELLGKQLQELKLITCHLGNGSSIAAIKYGVSVDTSMGFTPVAGLTMGTRCGDIDPSILPFLANEMQLSLNELDALLNKKSGVLGLSGISSDFRDLHAASEQNNLRAQLALKVFSYQIKKYIGAYAAAMDGVDGIIFTAGIGENDAIIRQDVIAGLSFLGTTLDLSKNDVRGELRILSTPESKVSVILVPTNEELMIARETQALCK